MHGRSVDKLSEKGAVLPFTQTCIAVQRAVFMNELVPIVDHRGLVRLGTRPAALRVRGKTGHKVPT